MKRIAILAALVLTAAAQPQAAEQAMPTLTLTPGETVTVRIASDPAGFILVSRERGEAAGEGPADAIRFIFTGGAHTMLQVENGYPQSFNYRARLTVGSRAASTSTCTAMPQVMVLESWPHPIDRLELSAPRLSDDAEMACR
jgi:hypothetical protein